jgi:four helix bundle protein
MNSDKTEYLKFYQTDLWKMAYTLLMKVYDLIEKYPQFEKYSLVDQTLRSANSILANIAEAHGRFYFKDRVRILYIARGEICEVQSHLWVGNGRKYIKNNEWITIEKEYEVLKMSLNSQIRFYSESSKK